MRVNTRYINTTRGTSSDTYTFSFIHSSIPVIISASVLSLLGFVTCSCIQGNLPKLHQSYILRHIHFHSFIHQAQSSSARPFCPDYALCRVLAAHSWSGAAAAIGAVEEKTYYPMKTRQAGIGERDGLYDGWISLLSRIGVLLVFLLFVRFIL